MYVDQCLTRIWTLTYYKVRDVHFYKCDVTDFDALIKLCGEIKRTHGDPSVLINNAGIGKSTLF